MRIVCKSLAAALVAGAAILSVPSAAYAIDVFGYKFFEPDPPAGSVVYETTFTVTPPDDDLADQLKAASVLESQSDTPPGDPASFVARVQADEQRLIGALYAAGYYGGSIHTLVAGQRIGDLPPGTLPRLPPNPVPVEVQVQPGPRFEFGRVSITQPAEGPDPVSSNPADYGIRSGRPARSSLVLAAESQLMNAWRQRGHPLVEIIGREIVADHAKLQLNVALRVDPGPRALFGEITIEGTEAVDVDFVRRIVNIEPGTVYSPKEVADARDRLRALNTFQSVRLIESETLTPDGRLPIIVSVADRKPRYVGASANWSSIDGAEINAYWGHRNLFGQAERLRIEGTVSELSSFDAGDYQYELKASFVKPAIIDIDTDFFTEATLFREHPDTDNYRTYGAKAQVGLTHRFSEALTGSIAVEGQVSHADDAFGERDYTLVGLPGTITYDKRDDRMNATEGYRVAGYVTPMVDVDRGHAFVINKVEASAYYPIDARHRYVLAGRVALGSTFGTDLPGIPPERRFYAGGGGSLRGYAYQNVGPRVNGDVVGGRGLAEASFEFRARVTETIGIVPFVDMATVSRGSIPGSGETVNKIGVGLGLRYYTAIGPVRLDVALPLSPEKDDPDFAIYIGLGQSF
ncbi:translocation and assembly module TamA [Rhodoligotrophos appendicifer]|uniref:autotransporter assembly complex protein TamA n=1 Tax=Rhodoligotrophos appendicifer TaxID=987056 RepID=UPI0011868774|nr:autotransporter assembly complex family protein [Rhodoligotrophos appendicifer]